MDQPIPARRCTAVLTALTALALAGGTLTAVPATAAPASFPARGNGRIVFDAELPDGHDAIMSVAPDGNQLTRLTDGTFHDLGPDVSADGRQVVFSSDRSGSFQLWAMGIDGSGLRQLTDAGDGQAYYPSWSPDGSTVVYRLSTSSDIGDVATIPAAGGHPTRLTDTPGLDSLPEWSPDGRHIAFHSARDDADPAGCSAAGDCVEAVYVMAADGSDQTRVAYDPGGQDRFPNWSPDGTHLIYEHWDSTGASATSHLWTVDADGTGAAPFTPAATYDDAYAPDFSPNGKYVTFERYGALYTVPVAGGRVTAVVPNDAFYALSPDWSVAKPALQTATVSLRVAPGAPVWGQPTTLTATVTGAAGTGVPSGTVTFRQGTTTVATAPVSDTGVATERVTTLEPYAGTLSATYSGDATHTGAVAYSASSVSPASTAVTLSVADGAAITYGDRVTARDRTLPPSRGAVADDVADVVVDGFHSGVPLVNGVVVVPVPELPAGDHTLQVCGPAQLEYTGACSATVGLSVGQGAGRVTLRSSATQVAPGARITLTAKVLPTNAGTTVDFRDGDTDLGTAGTDANGVARLSVRPVDPGPHSYTAAFAGDANLTAADSPAVVVDVG